MSRFRTIPVVPLLALGLVLAAAPWATASLSPKWTEDQLTDFATVVVTGQVSDMRTAWDPDGSGIYTYVTVDIDEVLKGAVASRRVVLKQAGGIIGELGMKVSGQPTFELGESVLLFAEVRPRDLSLYTTAQWQGKWTIEYDAATGGRVAVQRDPEIRSGNSEMGRRPLAAMAQAVSARAGDARGEAFHAVPLEYDDVARGAARPFVFLNPPTKWTSSPISVVIQAGGQPGLPGGGIGEIQNDIAQWNSVINFNWNLVSINGAARCASPFAGSGILTFVHNDPCGEISNAGGTIAVASTWFTTAVAETVGGVAFRRTLEVIIISNDSAGAQQFILNNPCYQQVMLHEMGHAKGLDHTTVAGAVMLATVSFSQCSAGALPLHPDDIAGAQAIYGASGGGTTPPGSAPTNVVATVSGSNLTVSFTGVNAMSVSPSAATSYRLDFRAGAQASGPVVASVTTSQTSVTIPIPPGTTGTFNVVVTGINSAGAGPSSSAAVFTIGGGGGCTSAPPTPTGVSGGISGGTATVTWNASAGATSYIVQAGTAPGGTDLFNANIGNNTGVTASGLPPGFSAWVRVIAVNACGQSAPSANFLVQ